MAKELDVFLEEQHIGKLVQTYRGAKFYYDEETCAKYISMPLLSLKPQPQNSYVGLIEAENSPIVG